MNIGKRKLGRVAGALFAREHYVALAGMLRVYPSPVDGLRRYLMGSGDYPADFAVRTPLGQQSIRLFGHHDMLTLNEVFCRGDYFVGPDLRLAVDFGSNIGISAAYFLTRNADARVHLFEPDPRNTARLRAQLAGFEGRWRLHESAVGVEAGDVVFAQEDTGRYGGLRAAITGDAARRAVDITVPCVDAETALREIIDAEGPIDILKLDVEGMETRILDHLSAETLGSIRMIYAECLATDASPAGMRGRQRGSIAIFEPAGA